MQQSRAACLSQKPLARVEPKTSALSSPAALLLAATAAIVLLRFSPAQYGFYPECPVYHFFGILCPGCGTTRALAALLRGHIAEALRFNPLTTVLMVASLVWVPLRRGRMHSKPSASAICILLAAAAVFTVLRNLS